MQARKMKKVNFQLALVNENSLATFHSHMKRNFFDSSVPLGKEMELSQKIPGETELDHFQLDNRQ